MREHMWLQAERTIMSLLVFDGRMGASGDMILAALISAGASADALSPVEDALGIQYVVNTETKAGILATRVHIVSDPESTSAQSNKQSTEVDGAHQEMTASDAHEDDKSQSDDSHIHDTAENDSNTHTHAQNNGQQDTDQNKPTHKHVHADGHDHSHDESVPIEGHGPARTYREVIEIVERMGLNADVESTAIEIFTRLGTAEAAVHGTSLSATQFHEVGTDDAIADIVGAALLLADMDVDRVCVTPVSTGSGEITMSHGSFSVPPPAVVEIAEEATWSLRGGPVNAELLTPTGAAILAHIAEGVQTLPTLTIAATGYGAGGYDFEEYPNVLRVLIGEVPTPMGPEASMNTDTIEANNTDRPQPDLETDRLTLDRESIVVLETNLDDATPEVLGSLQETLTDVGARDVTIVPTSMKKSRPGHLIKVITKPDDASSVAQRLAVETGTLGIREHPARHRWRANRTSETVTLTINDNSYEIAVKIGRDADGVIYDYSAEYDDALAVATTTDHPVREIRRRAEAAARSIITSDS